MVNKGFEGKACPGSVTLALLGLNGRLEKNKE